MKCLSTIFVFLGLLSLNVNAQQPNPMFGEDTVSAAYIRKWVHNGDFVHYMESQNDHIVYQGLHNGQWSQGDQLIFSVDGNSYRQNRYYLEGFRISDRFRSGNTLYVPNIEHYNTTLDVHSSRLYFRLDEQAGDYVQAQFNAGGLGEYDKSTAAIVHLFHNAGYEDLYKQNSLTNRQHITASGNVDMAFTLKGKESRYRQHLYAQFGQRQLPAYDQNGLLDGRELYGANNYKVQFDGQLPHGTWLDGLGYLVNFSGTGSYGSEFYLNHREVSDLKTYSASLYGRKRIMSSDGHHPSDIVSGLTWSTNVVNHKELGFRRNIIDQDGESFEPWSPDGSTHELTWFIRWERPLLSWLKLRAEGYNSMMHFSPFTTSWSNSVYQQHQGQEVFTPLYQIEWTSQAFTGGLLENSFGLEANHNLSKKVSLRAHLDATLDGYLLSQGKSTVSPNWEAGISFDIHPCRWFQMGVTLQHDRMAYGIEHLRYFSTRYMNGRVYYDNAAGGRGALLTTTGGAYHSKSGLMQPSYLTLDIPIRFRFQGRRGKHEIVLQQTYRKYINQWFTQMAGGDAANGSWQDDWYFLNPSERQYEVVYQPHSLMGDGFLFNTPYYISQLTRYTYTGKRFTCSVSWQNIIGAGLPLGLSNGPASNNFGTLSELSASPNTLLVSSNKNGKTPAVGRLDQDKGFILRTYFGYNICRWVQAGLLFKWTDGQPFSIFNTNVKTDAPGNTQAAIRPSSTRGTNPTDGDFGTRESAIFNFDLHVRAQWTAAGHPMSLTLLCYNLWDFGNVLNEYTFPQGVRGMDERGHNMCLTIPRGLITTFKVGL